MKRKTNILILLILISLLSTTSLHAQIITTIAGNGSIGHTGDGGPATAAAIHMPPTALIHKNRNLYISHGNYIRMVDTMGIINVFAGGGTGGDGVPATAANISVTGTLCEDSIGNIYFASIHRIRKIDTAGIISTIAGSSIAGYSGDGGPATLATFSNPGSLSFDKFGNLYVTQNRCIRKINTAGIVSTVVGDCITDGYSGDGGAATAAIINQASRVAADQYNNLYFADNANHRIRKIDTNGIITTFAGTGVAGYSGDGGVATAAMFNIPQGVAFDPWGNLVFSDLINNRIRKISPSGIVTTLGGSGLSGFSGDGGLATAATISAPTSVSINPKGDIYFCDYSNRRIRRISSFNRAPYFVLGSMGYLSACTEYNPLDTLLQVVDSNSGQPITWSLLVPPAHGFVAAGYSTTATGGVLTPVGTGYTPVSGYTGPDTFAVRVTDNGAADTITIAVTVLPHPVAAPISGADTLCVGNTTTLSAPTTGGTWTTTATTTATVGSSTGTVTGLTTGTATITYTVANACGTATATHTLTILPATDCPTGITTQHLGMGYGIVPNPTSGSMTIVQPSPQPATIVVRSIDGRQQLSEHTITATTPISVSHLPAGIYTIQIITATSQWVGKVVVE